MGEFEDNVRGVVLSFSLDNFGIKIKGLPVPKTTGTNVGPGLSDKTPPSHDTLSRFP